MSEEAVDFEDSDVAGDFDVAAVALNLTDGYELLVYAIHSNLTMPVFGDTELAIVRAAGAPASLPPSAMAFARQITFMACFMMTALVGNLTLLLHCVRIRAWRRPVTIFIMSLSICKTRSF